MQTWPRGSWYAVTFSAQVVQIVASVARAVDSLAREDGSIQGLTSQRLHCHKPLVTKVTMPPFAALRV